MTNTVDNFKWTDELVKEYATSFPVCYWRIKQLKPPTIQYTFDNPKGKIKLP